MTDHLEDWVAETAESITARLEGARKPSGKRGSRWR